MNVLNMWEDCAHFQAFLLNFLSSARAVWCHHRVSFRIISPIFLRFLGPRLCHPDFQLITHHPPSDEPVLAPGHFSTLLPEPPLTCIDNDCHWNESIKAASLTRLQNVLIVGRPPSDAVHYASLIAKRFADTRHVHYGTDGFPSRAGCHSQASFDTARIVFSRICRWIGSSSSCVCWGSRSSLYRPP